MPSESYAPEIVDGDNLIEMIDVLVTELSTLQFILPPHQAEAVKTLIDRLAARSNAILKAKITKTNKKLATATRDIKMASESAKSAINEIEKTQEAIKQAAVAVRILDEALKLIGVFVIP